MDLPEPFVIAEISANHNGSFKRAIALIDAAAAAGSDAVKFQCFTPDTITIDHDGPGFVIEEGPWAGKTLYELYSQAHTPWDWFEHLFLHAEKRGVIAFSSVFDKTSVDFLEELDCPIYKISSFEITDVPLIRHAANTDKPIIISSGMANDDEICNAAIHAGYPHDPVVLHCVSDYPANAVGANLKRLDTIWCIKGVGRVGLSDHTLSTTLPAVAIGMGATVIEKHLTLRRSDGGPDAEFSLEPDEFKAMTQAVREAYSAIQPSPIPTPYKGLRRSLYAVRDIAAGDTFNPENVRSIRPGGGISPAKTDDLMGRQASRPFSFGDPITEDQLNDD